MPETLRLLPRAAVLPRLIAVLALLALPLPAAAIERAALVFGADRYTMLRPLGNAGGDARAVGEALALLGFTVTFEQDRDLRRMRRALEDFAIDAAGAEVAVVFYAGHGVEIAGENRLLPVDADASSLDRLRETTLPLEEVRAAVSAIAPVVLILLDACREDPYGSAGGAGRGGVRLPKEVAEAARPGLGRVGQAENTLFAFAAAPGAVASDGDGDHSPFTTALIRYLGTRGLEIRSVLTLVQQEVYDRTGGGQLPYVENGLPVLFFAGDDPGDLSERERLLLAMAGLDADLRAEVERIAKAADVPLAPLFGAVIAADLGHRGLQERRLELEAAARAFADTRDRLRNLSSTDPEVERLRAEARDRLALGALDEAQALLDQAIELDKSSRAGLKANLVERTVSAAASLAAKAGVARTALDHPSAIAALVEAAALHDEIDGFDLSFEANFQRETILSDLGILYNLTGDTRSALAVLRRYHALASARFAKTGAPEAERSLAVSLDRLGDLAMAMGDMAAAMAAYEEGLAISNRIAIRNPDIPLAQRDLAVSHLKLGDARRQLGDIDGAIQSFRVSLAISATLAAAAPADAEAQRDLMVAHTRLGDALRDGGDLPAALAEYQAGLDMALRLAADAPEDAELLRDLSVNYGKVGGAKYLGGDYQGGLEASLKSLEISRRQGATDPMDTQYQRDIAVAQMQVGDLRAALLDYPGALADYEAGLAVQRALSARDPGNTSWLRDMATGLGRVGDMQAMTGDLAAAQETHAKALAIYYGLTALDPANAFWQRDLIVGHFKLALAGVDKLAHLRAALAIAESLEARGALASSDSFIPGFLRTLIAEEEAAR